MPNPEIEEFAKILVQKVRDSAIRACDRRLQADAKGPVTKRWKELTHEGNLAAIADVLIPDIVDSALAQLLLAIDQELLPISFTAMDGKVVDLPADGLGELCGWYMGTGDGGWRPLYAKERFVDDFLDLK